MDKLHSVYIVSAVRTPIGKFGGTMSSLTAVDLGQCAVTAAIDRAQIPPSAIDATYFGNVIQAGNGQNPARQIAIKSGIPYEVPAVTLNAVCASGLEAVNIAARNICLGEYQLAVAGGTESMSNAPYLLNQARFGYRLGDSEIIDSVQRDGLQDAFRGYSMGITAENVAKHYHISRQEMDQFALSSHQKAVAAQDQGRFADEIIPITVKQKKRTFVVNEDEAPRRNTSSEALAKLHPAFCEDGLVTAGNSSGINDGAAAVILASEEAVEKYNLRPLAQWLGGTLVGVDPALMGTGPIPATKRLLKKATMSVAQIDRFEINEAFAAQAIPVIRELGIAPDKVNPNGGAIALGHPLADSGTRILVTLIHEMRRQNDHYGVATLCVGGGMGCASLIKTVD